MHSWRRKIEIAAATAIASAIAPAALARPATGAANPDALAIQNSVEFGGRTIVPPTLPPTAAAPAPVIVPPPPIQVPGQLLNPGGRFGTEAGNGAINPGPNAPEPPVVTVVPLPTPVGLGMAGLLIVSTIRRRKSV